MDHVLAKVKRLRKAPIFKLISDHTLFTEVNVDLSACVTYNPDHNLDEETWFKINDFSNQSFCIDILKTELDATSYDNLPKDKFTDISHIYSIQSENFYFQKVTPSLFIRKKTIIFGDIAKIEESGPRLIVNSQPDAIYYTTSDTLIFKNLATISNIFPGIDQLYKEATREEVKDFLSKPFISLSNDFDENKVSKPNRKRIALAMETFDILLEPDKVAILSYINDYCGEQLKYDGESGKFEISSDNDLKLLIYGIDQRFYTTPVGQETRLANSIQAFNQQENRNP